MSEYPTQPDKMNVVYFRTLEGKTNKESKEDFFVIARHKHIVMCPVSGFGSTMIMQLVQHREDHPVTEETLRSMEWCAANQYMYNGQKSRVYVVLSH